MITTIFYIIAFLALFHFVYEGILLPTIRLKQRYKLFVLRDKLRRLFIERRSEIDKKTFKYMDRGINNLITIIPRLDFAHFFKFWKLLKEDQRLKNNLLRNIEENKKMIAGCEVIEIKDIDKEARQIMIGVFIYNSSGWLVYLLPILFAILVKDVLLNKILDVTTGVSHFSEKEVDKLIPRIV